MFTLNPCSTDFTDSADLILKFAGGLGALIIFTIGLRRYRMDQTWRRNEFLAKEIKAFHEDKMAQNVMYMLDWTKRRIELFPDHPEYEKRFVIVDRELLASSLVDGKSVSMAHKSGKFTNEEAAIRDHFDGFLAYFEKFERYIKAKLIREEEIKPYMNYWIISMTDKLNPEVRKVLSEFIRIYGYRDTQAFFRRFGKTI